MDERPFVEVFSPGQISALYCQPPVGSANKLCLSSHGNTFSNCTTKCIRENQNGMKRIQSSAYRQTDSFLGSVDILFCCGLCIDILENLAQMANVTYDLFLSKDGTYGGRRLVHSNAHES